MPARVRAWRGGRRRQGDGGWRLHRVVHGQDQPGASDCDLMFSQGELVIQALVGRAPPGAGSGSTLAVDGAGAVRVCADGDVGVHGAHAGVVQDEVGVILVELAFILTGGEAKDEGGGRGG